MNTQRTRAMIEPETELTLTVAPVTAGAFAAGDITVIAHVAPERAAPGRGSRYRVVLTVTNRGARTVGAFDVTARIDDRRDFGAHRVRTVTHSVAPVAPGASVRIESLVLLGLRPVKTRALVAAELPQERVLTAAAA